MQPAGKIDTVELFPGLSRRLLQALGGLSAEQWNRPTVCGDWTVKDVAAHLLGGSLSRLWRTEERAQGMGGAALSFAELLALIDAGNAAWVQGARRISPHLLMDFLQLTDGQLYRLFRGLDPDQPAGANVAWAGETVSPNWFDIAREYTEKWLHQQHIRQAVGLPLLSGRRWLHPVLETFLRALPYAYRDVAAAPASTLGLHIRGAAGGDWTLRRADAGWQLYGGSTPAPTARLALDQDSAWRLLTRGLAAETALERAVLSGEHELCLAFFSAVAIMA